MTGPVYRERNELPGEYAALVCHRCHHRYVGGELDELLIVELLQCLQPHCDSVGMLVANASTLEERFPAALTRAWTALPDILLAPDQLIALGVDLGAHDLLVIWALESYRWHAGRAVWPSRQTLADKIGLSPETVKRTLSGLVARRLIDARYRPGRTTEYSLEPLWERLAGTEPGSHRPGSHRPGSDRPDHPGLTDPTTRVSQTPEAEEGEAEEGQAESVAVATRPGSHRPDRDEQEWF